MIDPTNFRDLVSGKRRGVGATAARRFLQAVEVPYSIAVRWRNRRYDLGHAAIHSAGVPVVSVGNLTLGGTGKTPLVKWIARWAGEQGVRAAIVSRGYGAAAGQQNDEARELAQTLPGVPHVQNPDRVAAARRAVDEFSAKLIILDDGFQHRRLARDLDIVLVDALQPFGFEHVFPRGMLREPVCGLARADVVCLSRADLVLPTERDAIRRRASQLAPRAAWCEAIHTPASLINATGEQSSLDALRGRRIAAFCGLGNPAGFRRTLEATDCQVVAWREFPDHHVFTAADIHSIVTMTTASRAELAICTHKDLVKLSHTQMGECPLWAVTVDLRFLIGQEAMESALAHAMRTANLR